MIVSVLAAAPDGVYVTEHVAVAPVPVRVHVPVKAPVPLVPNATVPVGVLIVATSVSETVAVQVVLTPVLTEAGVQLTDVDVVRLLIMMLVVPLLPA